jgi:hypothetical protein
MLFALTFVIALANELSVHIKDDTANWRFGTRRAKPDAESTVARRMALSSRAGSGTVSGGHSSEEAIALGVGGLFQGSVQRPT